MPEETKCCSKCREIKNISAFGKDKQRRDGLRPSCKECRQIEALQNKEIIAEKNKQYWLNNKIRLNAQNKHYYYAHKKEIAIKKKEYKSKNKEQHKLWDSLRYYAKRTLILQQHRDYYRKNKRLILEKKRVYSCNKNINVSNRFLCCIKYKPYILKRDKYRCSLCKSKKLLIMHHIVPMKENRELLNNTKNLITLCSRCHLKHAHAGVYNKINKHIQIGLILKQNISTK